MINKPEKPINLFDCAASQKVIGQEKFLEAFKRILEKPFLRKVKRGDK